MINDHKLYEGLDDEQSKAMDEFLRQWEKFVIELGITVYGKTDVPFNSGTSAMTTLLKALYETATQRNTYPVNQHRMTMLFGYLLGTQLGAHMIAEKLDRDIDLMDKAAMTFWSALRTGVESAYSKEEGGDISVYGADGRLIM